jgi:hypothetical protein
MYVMTDEWVADVKDIDNELIMRGAVATFDDINLYDLPVAADLLLRAKYFLVVVDEQAEADDADSQSALPDVKDAGAEDDRSIPTAPHKARVCLWRLADGKEMLALRREAAGALRNVRQDNAALEPRTMIFQQRQANSCALALEVREAMGAHAGAAVPDDDDEPDGGGGSGAAQKRDAGSDDG